jgi:hypothetical protein
MVRGEVLFELEVADEGTDVGVEDDVGLECDKTADEEVRSGDVLTNMGVREAERWGEEGEVFDGRES